MSQSIKKFGGDSNNRIYVRMNTDPLEAIEKELGKQFVAQVGVLGSHASGRLEIKNEKVGGKSGNRKVPVVQGKSVMSNADIGLIHEKGSPVNNIPRRSFLEVPLTMKMPGIMSKLDTWFSDSFKSGSIDLVYKRLAKVAEGIVLQAFPTSGYGTWPALKRGSTNVAGYGRHGGDEAHLIDTGQLRQSISSRVVSK